MLRRRDGKFTNLLRRGHSDRETPTVCAISFFIGRRKTRDEGDAFAPETASQSQTIIYLIYVYIYKNKNVRIGENQIDDCQIYKKANNKKPKAGSAAKHKSMNYEMKKIAELYGLFLDGHY